MKMGLRDSDTLHFQLSFVSPLITCPLLSLPLAGVQANSWDLKITQKDNHPEIRFKSAVNKVALLEK